MLEANKSPWFENVFAVYNRNLLRRRFNSLLIDGLEILSEKLNRPTVIYSNHSSWWDGLIAFQISHQTNSDSFIMMEEKQLKSLPGFRKLGAFSVVRENPRQARESLHYAIGLLNEMPSRTLWIFPQGEIQPNDRRPLKFYNGLVRIIENVENCRVINLAMRYEFLGEFKPEVFVKIGAADFNHRINMTDTTYKKNRNNLTKTLADQLTDNLDRLKTDIINKRTDEYLNII
jgi:1-acyl-sn-glycerol-3-phosphate acyltransferase